MSEKWKIKTPTSLSLKCNIWVKKWAGSYKHLQSPHLLQERENPKVPRPGSYKRNQICSDLHKNCWEHFSIWYCAKILFFTTMVKRVQSHRNCYAEYTKPPGIFPRIAGSTQITANWESAISRSSLLTWILQLPLTRSIWRPEIGIYSFKHWLGSVKKTTSQAVTPCDSMISTQECWDGGSARGGTAEGPRGHWGNWEIVLISLFWPETTQGPTLCKCFVQWMDRQPKLRLIPIFLHISLTSCFWRKVLRSTLRKIRQNLKMNAMLEIAYITNLLLIGTINKNTY